MTGYPQAMSKDHQEHSKSAHEAVISLLRELIRKPSITPQDCGCQELLAARLEVLGFACERLPFAQVSNLWARKGTEAPLLCFAGHTDVVPPGISGEWSTDPFDPVLKDGYLHGRGAVDMKGGLAAMLHAVEQFVGDQPDHDGSIAFLITSDEEGPALDGTKRVLETLAGRGELIDYCIIGEPSSNSKLGDVIRIGRRGSLSCRLEIKGVQGHVAYPQHADNPIHRFAPVLSALHDFVWDEGNENFPPTSMQMVEVQATGGAANVTPPKLFAEFNFRYSTEWNAESLQEKVAAILEPFDLDHELAWTLSGEPYLTEPGHLIDAVVAAVSETTGQSPQLSTGGGTSDGRFISPAGAQVVELGLINATAHKVDECVNAEDVDKLAGMYRRIIEILLLD
jgi:succinyl-diaminopimelate desuccinylase